jgi:hypothetical protein
MALTRICDLRRKNVTGYWERNVMMTHNFHFKQILGLSNQGTCSTHGRNNRHILFGKPEENITFKRLGVDVGIILKQILKKLVLGMWTPFI